MRFHINMGLDDGALDTEFTFGGYEAAPVQKSSIRPRLTASRPLCGFLPARRHRPGLFGRNRQRGRIKELDGGTLKTGDNTQQKVSMANTYYR